MTRFLVLLTVALLMAPILSLLLGTGRGDGLLSSPRPPVLPPAALMHDAHAPANAAPDSIARSDSAPVPVGYREPGEEELFTSAAKEAWSYVVSQSQPGTGLVNSVIGYPYATIWDIASGLAAVYSAHRLGLIEQAEYDRRLGAALSTLKTMPLFDDAAFNKNYRTKDGRPAARNNRQRTTRADGYGWSAVDMGRLLVWLRIVARTDPQHAAAAQAVVDRFDMERLVADGYLQGESLDSRGRQRRYQEGRIGYEQYAAAGFALWGARPDRALNWGPNVREVEVYDVPVLTDRRGDAMLTSEPFFLLGLELGWWDPEWRVQAQRVLATQSRRYRQTGRLTMVSEDAIPVPPAYFYYYTILDEGEPFAVRALGDRVPSPAPRWVSTKAAFAWYALMPDAYNWQVLRAVHQGARSPGRGWSAGLYERSGKRTGSENINTAAVVLEAALYHRVRRPLALAGGAAPARGATAAARTPRGPSR